MKSLFAAVLMTFQFLAFLPAAAEESLQLGVSVDYVPVGSDFDGRDIVIFGSIENAEQAALYRGEYDVVIEIIGALEEVIVRKKERRVGIWINAKAREYVDVPSYYAVLSRNPLRDISNPLALRDMGIGVENIKARPASQTSVQQFLTTSSFSQALRRVRISEGLFSESPDGLKQLSPSLFRATLDLPPNVPIGEHTVRAHLFRGGQKLAEIQSRFEIRKVGFERWIYDLAHEQSLLYGIMAVFIAIFTGWAANAVFRKS